MKNSKRSLSLLVSIVMLVSMLFGVVGTAFAAVTTNATFTTANVTGVHVGNVYQEYKLFDDVTNTQINLDSTNVSSIKVTKPDTTVVTLTTDTDTSLWFNVQNATGDYQYTVVLTDGTTTYNATLHWVQTTGIELNKTSLSLPVGYAPETLTTTFTPSDATNQNVTWSSDNEAVATVDTNGVVTPIVVGTANITATSAVNPLANATCFVTVPSTDATLTLSSDVGTVNDANGTIAAVASTTSLTSFKNAITPATSATFEVYDADGTTLATTLVTGSKVIVTAQDGSTTKTYTVTVNDPTVEVPITNVKIESNNAVDSTKAKVGDTVTLSFNTTEKVSKLSNFKINGGNPVDFSSTQNGNVFDNVATYVVDSSDAEGAINFQINVENSVKTASQTIEQTNDGSAVDVIKTGTAPVISNVEIFSNNAESSSIAKVGDTVKLRFTTVERVAAKTDFNFNGSKPKTFTSVKVGNEWVNTAIYTIDSTDPSGIIKFQINVKNALGLYSITTEETNDGSFVEVFLPVSTITGNNILLVGVYAFDLGATPDVSGYNLNNFINAAKTVYENPTGTNHVYFKLGNNWYDLIENPTLDLTRPVAVVATINGDGLYEFLNMH